MDWTQIIEAIDLPALGVMALAIVFQVARAYIAQLEAGKLQDLLLELVKAAEQIYGAGKGVAKRQYVEEQLSRRGLGKVRRDAIEAAVFDLNNGPTRPVPR